MLGRFASVFANSECTNAYWTANFPLSSTETTWHLPANVSRQERVVSECSTSKGMCKLRWSTNTCNRMADWAPAGYRILNGYWTAQRSSWSNLQSAGLLRTLENQRGV